MADKVKSLHVTVTEEDVRILDEMKKKTGAATRAELIRKSLQLYLHLSTRAQDGYALKLHKEDESDILVFIP